MNIKQLQSWVNREINITVDQLQSQKRYGKRFSEGYLLALKKVQTQFNMPAEKDKPDEVKLCISGNDLVNRYGMVPGPEMGDVLKKLLKGVIDGDIKNDKETLFNNIDQWYKPLNGNLK